jgi:hypothetical protein
MLTSALDSPKVSARNPRACRTPEAANSPSERSRRPNHSSLEGVSTVA